MRKFGSIILVICLFVAILSYYSDVSMLERFNDLSAMWSEYNGGFSDLAKVFDISDFPIWGDGGVPIISIDDALVFIGQVLLWVGYLIADLVGFVIYFLKGLVIVLKSVLILFFGISV